MTLAILFLFLRRYVVEGTVHEVNTFNFLWEFLHQHFFLFLPDSCIVMNSTLAMLFARLSKHIVQESTTTNVTGVIPIYTINYSLI